MYPHNITGVLASKSRNTIRRNMAALPSYTLMLAFIALFGYMAIAKGIHVSDNNLALPRLFQVVFPNWFVGIAFAAIGIGALVPAAIMAISAANLFHQHLEGLHQEGLQPLGGVWILQTFPAIVFGLYTRWFHRWALVAGWAAGQPAAQAGALARRPRRDRPRRLRGHPRRLRSRARRRRNRRRPR
jgi:solute:Na+ symporter, SSS family